RPAPSPPARTRPSRAARCPSPDRASASRRRSTLPAPPAPDHSTGPLPSLLPGPIRLTCDPAISSESGPDCPPWALLGSYRALNDAGHRALSGHRSPRSGGGVERILSRRPDRLGAAADRGADQDDSVVQRAEPRPIPGRVIDRTVDLTEPIAC